MRIEVSPIQFLDSSACKSILVREGTGKVKHLEIRQLRGQWAVKHYNVEVHQIPRQLNVADALTDPVTQMRLSHFLLRICTVRFEHWKIDAKLMPEKVMQK